MSASLRAVLRFLLSTLLWGSVALSNVSQAWRSGTARSRRSTCSVSGAGPGADILSQKCIRGAFLFSYAVGGGAGRKTTSSVYDQRRTGNCEQQASLALADRIGRPNVESRALCAPPRKELPFWRVSRIAGNQISTAALKCPNAGRGKMLSYGYPAVRISARLLVGLFFLRDPNSPPRWPGAIRRVGA